MLKNILDAAPTLTRPKAFRFNGFGSSVLVCNASKNQFLHLPTLHNLTHKYIFEIIQIKHLSVLKILVISFLYIFLVKVLLRRLLRSLMFQGIFRIIRTGKFSSSLKECRSQIGSGSTYTGFPEMEEPWRTDTKSLQFFFFFLTIEILNHFFLSIPTHLF